ncbi:hypothetical protein IWW57_001197 [Coemansia sp. S610]|nr:hypothetical protein IWW57_001197 [Coemansia sp. S610]KAJ2697690.1 hypothetical protein H4218_003784 [Coemansia sp. IMI 209128]
MFTRLATRTARTVSVNRRVTHRLIASYTSDSIPPSDNQGNSANNDNKEAPLSSLLDMLSTQRPSTPASKAPKVPKFSQMLSNDKPMKGDFSGFIGSGRYCGHAETREREDPMSLLVLHVHSSSNNTILSLTDANGKVIVNASGGTVGFKKAQRAGFEAAYQATASIAATVKERGINVRSVELRLKGFGAGREAAFKAVNSVTNWAITRIVDTTPIPFNGCRPKKARRL